MMGSYVPVRGRATVALVFLGFVSVALAFNVIATLNEIDLLERIAAGERVPSAELEGSARSLGTAALVFLIGFVGSGVSVLVWMHRASKNLVALGVTNQRHSPRMSIIWWFVPFAALYLPYAVMKEIAQASHPVADRDGNAWETAPVPRLLGFWWSAWLIAMWGGNLAAASLWNAGTAADVAFVGQRGRAAEFVDASWLSLSSDVLLVGAAIMAGSVIWGITRNQMAKQRQLDGGAAR